MATEREERNQRMIEEFRSNGGTTERWGRQLVLVHHRGAKSGVVRITPLTAAISDETGWYVTASAGGSEKAPNWYYNLVAHPDIVIETPDEAEVQVRAVELAGEERARIWQRLLEESPDHVIAASKTTREFPIIAFRRR